MASGGAPQRAKVLSSKPKIFRRAGLMRVTSPCSLNKVNNLQATTRREVLTTG